MKCLIDASYSVKKDVKNSVSDNEETLDGSTKEKKKTERETNP